MKRNLTNCSRLFFFLLLFCSFSGLAASGYASRNGGTNGGEGGKLVLATTGLEIHQAICKRKSYDTPLIIHVEGLITHENTVKAEGSCSTSDDVIKLKKVSNISLIGVGKGALFDEIGIHIRSSSNIILQNLQVRNVKKSGPKSSNRGDAIGIDANVSNVWVDHCTLEGGNENNNQYDSLLDMKNGTRFVTVSYSVLKNSGRGGLIGSSTSDDSNNFITYHHNLFSKINTRTPLVRHATVHVFNNFYKDIAETGINVRAGARAKIENNYFENTQDPLGTYYTEHLGYWQLSNNIWVNVKWDQAKLERRPAGPKPVSTTNVKIPYSYLLDAPTCVPNTILQYAGANKGLNISDGKCSHGAYEPKALPPAPAVSSNSSSSSSSTSSSSSSSGGLGKKTVIEENQSGFCSVDGKLDTKNSGFSGTAYADTDNAKGKQITYAVEAQRSGKYLVSFTYANGSLARPAHLVINGAIASKIEFEPTGSWSKWKISGENRVYLGEGINEIQLESEHIKGLANIDNLIMGVGLSPGACDKLAL